MNLFQDTKSGADFSVNRKYRFRLWRIWDESLPKIMFIGLNPSTANENTNDPTIRRVISFARRWGYGGVHMLNLFPYISTNPNEMMDFYTTRFHDIEEQRNDDTIEITYKECSQVIFAWGNFDVAKEKGAKIASKYKAQCLGKNRNGSPKHPLYVKSDVQIIQY